MPGAKNRCCVEDLESNVANIERMAKRAKVRADELFQPCTYVVEGCERLDAAFKRLVSDTEVSDWRALKQAAACSPYLKIWLSTWVWAGHWWKQLQMPQQMPLPQR